MLGLQRLAAGDHDRSHNDASGQCVNVLVELGAEPSFLLRFDTLEASVDVDALPSLIGPHRAGFDGLLATQDQLCPRLSKAKQYASSELLDVSNVFYDRRRLGPMNLRWSTN